MKHAGVLLPILMSLFAARASGMSPDNERLSAAQLSQASRAGPWPMSSFAPAADARPATNVFEGRLRLGPEYARQRFRLLLDRYGDATANQHAAERLPEFDFDFVQSGDALIPLRRGAIPDASPA